MFKGVGAVSISFSFSNGVVTGTPTYSFDLRAPLSVASPAEKDFYRNSPQQLIHFVYEDWNKKFNPNCILSGGNLYLGVQWDTYCLQQAGTPNPLSAAGMAIQTAVGDWGKQFLGPSTPTTPPSSGGGTQPPSGGGTVPSTSPFQTGGSTGGSTSGDSFCIADVCIPKMALYVAGGLLLFMFIKK